MIYKCISEMTIKYVKNYFKYLKNINNIRIYIELNIIRAYIIIYTIHL